MRTASLVLLTCAVAGALCANDAAARTRTRHRPAQHATAGAAAPAEPPQLVRLDAGQVQGLAVDGVVAFKGVPYAQPPVGPLRWRAPQPPKPWTGVLAADRFGPDCMQAGDAPQSEDCLTLDVWRPAGKADRPRPVVVWIHGGGLVGGGSAEAPGDALAQQGLVVVSINYRLGRFGFFDHPALDAEAPDEAHGDYGYLDQLAALAWVQRNIAAFGGDPKLVTIAGRADDGSVTPLLTSPLSRGLFQRAVLTAASRPGLQPKALPLTDVTEAQRRGLEYALSRGVAGDGAEALRRLRALPAADLVDGVSEDAVLRAASHGGYVIGVAGPIRDGRLILEAPETAIAAGRQAMTPLLVVADDPDYGLDSASDKAALFARFGRQADEARKLYDPAGDRPLDALKRLVAADAAADEPARRLADLAARSGQPTWLYRFSYAVTSPRNHRKSAQQAVESEYVFTMPASRADGGPGGSGRVTDALAGAYLVSFATTGDPNGAGRPTWPRHQPVQDKTVDASASAARTTPSTPRPSLWLAALDEAGAPVEAAEAKSPK